MHCWAPTSCSRKRVSLSGRSFTNLGQTGKPSLSRTPKKTPLKRSGLALPSPAKASGGVKKGGRRAAKPSAAAAAAAAEELPAEAKKTPRKAASAAAAVLAVAAEEAGEPQAAKRTLKKAKKVWTSSWRGLEQGLPHRLSRSAWGDPVQPRKKLARSHPLARRC